MLSLLPYNENNPISLDYIIQNNRLYQVNSNNTLKNPKKTKMSEISKSLPLEKGKTLKYVLFETNQILSSMIFLYDSIYFHTEGIIFFHFQ